MFNDVLHIFFPDKHTLSNGKVVKEKLNPTPYIILALIALVFICAVVTDVNFAKFFKRFTKGWSFVIRMLNPRWDYWEVARLIISSILRAKKNFCTGAGHSS